MTLARPRPQLDPVGIVSFIVPLALYAACMSSSPSGWDTGEMQTSAWILGIPHTTGFPLYIILGWAFSHVFAFSTVAWRLNFLSGCCIAGASFFIYQTARVFGATRTGSLAASLLFALGHVAWVKAIFADVHALATLCVSLCLYFLARYAQYDEDGALGWAALADGLGMAAHPNALWLIPGLVLAYATAPRRTALTALRAALALVAPLGLYLLLPLRSATIAALGLDPSAPLPLPDGELSWSLCWDTNKTRTLDGFVAELTGRQGPATHAIWAIFQVQNYPQDAAYWWSYSSAEFGAIGLVLALCGLIVLARHNRRAAAVLVVAGFAEIPFGVAYGLGGESDVARYFIASFAAITIFIAFAAQIVVTRPRRLPLWPAVLLAIAVAGYPMWVDGHNTLLPYRADAFGQKVIDAAQAQVPADSIVLASWLDAPNLAYGRDVEGVLPGRIFIARGPEAMKPVLHKWRAMHRVFVFSDWVLDNELHSLPASVYTPRPLTLDGHHLYEVCADPANCKV